jgi:hypothetical protein
VGKTYFWHQFKEQLTGKKVAYVSLFGKETISSIRTDIPPLKTVSLAPSPTFWLEFGATLTV